MILHENLKPFITAVGRKQLPGKPLLYGFIPVVSKSNYSGGEIIITRDTDGNTFDSLDDFTCYAF
jgi:hypothetical protein